MSTSTRKELSTDDYTYTGDVDIEHGGTFLDLSTYGEGYVSALRVQNVSGCLDNGADWLAERITVITDGKAEKVSGLETCGYANKDRATGIVTYNLPELRNGSTWAQVSEFYKFIIIESLIAYGYYDPDDGWDNYRSPSSAFVAVLDDGDPLNTSEEYTLDQSDNAVSHIRDGDLFKWLHHNGWLNDF